MTADPVAVFWQVAEDEQMTRVVRKGSTIASPDWAHSVHVEASGLRPDRWYWYQFKAGSEISPKGRTRTMPLHNSSPDRLCFAFASCQHYEQGYYTAYEHMVREDLDLVVHLGDYIYENAGQDNGVRRHPGLEIVALDDYRNRYALYKSDEALKAAHAAAPWLVTWDDHEVDNNYAGAISEEGSVSREQLLKRRAAAYQAHYEHMPLRRTLPKGPDMKIYRRVPFGRLAEFFVLDTRQYRTDQPCGDRTGPPCDEVFDPAGTLLGRRQCDWLFKCLRGSPARWNVLAQQVMMARVDRTSGDPVEYSMDQWSGYEVERRRLLRFLRDQKIRNPIVLTGDIHSNWANELITDFDQMNSPPVAAEFVGSSISSGGDGARMPAYLDQLYAENPFVKFHTAERGYVRCQVSAKEWRTAYQAVEYVTRKGAPLVTRGTFLVESGSSQLNRA